jgi:hypothetical protein
VGGPWVRFLFTIGHTGQQTTLNIVLFLTGNMG